jgi:hypothetical protein
MTVRIWYNVCTLLITYLFCCSLKGGFDLREFDTRMLKDRRVRPTPLISKFTFLGRRRTFRRKVDQQRGGYIDRYSSELFFFLILIAGLNILDAFFTMMILNAGGWEFNPIVDSVITLYGDKFWVWKFAIVSASLMLLCLHSKFRFVKAVILGITAIYIGIVLRHLSLIIHL